MSWVDEVARLDDYQLLGDGILLREQRTIIDYIFKVADGHLKICD
jgi:hypothetical protein